MPPLSCYYYFYRMQKHLIGLFLLACLQASAQQQVSITLDEHTKDDRFDKFNLNFALFELKGDTILSWDYEGVRKAVPLKVKKPSGYAAYAYGFLFFGGNTAGYNPGYITVIVGNPYHKNPVFYPDLNNNLDFTDDDFSAALPWRGDSAQVRFCLPGTTRCAQFRFTRHKLNANIQYKELMNEYYTTMYPGRKFLGMDHSYREQHYQMKAGVLTTADDTFRIALYDGNFNGVYNEPDSDRMVVANMNDTVFYPFDDLHGALISNRKGACFIDKNGRQYEFVSASPDGALLTVNVLGSTLNDKQVKAGRKLPRFKFITWKGEKKKIARYRRQQLYIYFGNPGLKTFTEDTIALRRIADQYKGKVFVLGFIEVQKSYELRIYGQYWELNWLLAYKDKEINRKLGIRGLPSSILTKKRRRVIQYNLRPAEVLRLLNEQQP